MGKFEVPPPGVPRSGGASVLTSQGRVPRRQFPDARSPRLDGVSPHPVEHPVWWGECPHEPVGDSPISTYRVEPVITLEA